MHTATRLFSFMAGAIHCTELECGVSGTSRLFGIGVRFLGSARSLVDFDIRGGAAEPSTLYPTLETLSPKPSTLHPEPQTLQPASPKPRNLCHKTRELSLKPERLTVDARQRRIPRTGSSGETHIFGFEDEGGLQGWFNRVSVRGAKAAIPNFIGCYFVISEIRRMC